MIPPMTFGKRRGGLGLLADRLGYGGRIWYPESLLLRFPSLVIDGASALPSADPTRIARIVGRELGEVAWTGRADTMFQSLA